VELDVEIFALPKLGADAEEYEDAASPSGRCHCSGSHFTFAVADGATEASFSGLWARLLVEGYTSECANASLMDVVTRAAESWTASVGARVLPWYAEQKAASGAFAAFLGVKVDAFVQDEHELVSYSADAVGDCCLIHMRGGTLIAAFPLTRSEEFNSTPSLLATRVEPNCDVEIHRTSGFCNEDDMLLLMSDAIARWFLAELESGGQPWEQIRDLETSDGVLFQDLVCELRSSNVLKNDDTTLMRITIC